MPTGSVPTLEIQGLTISTVDAKGHILTNLVTGLELTLNPGEITGLVGESGSGKSITASAILGLLPSRLNVTSGSIKLLGAPLESMTKQERRSVRGRRIAYVFQNYQGSFNPFLPIGKQLVEAIRSHEEVGRKEAAERARCWLSRVQLPADRVFTSYPFQLSGGQLQRASLAASLMLRPELLIADEPTTALDVLSGEQVLELMVQLQRETGCAILLISHDLTHILKHTDRMAVMYGGSIVEAGLTARVGCMPQHPYTRLLMQARPPFGHAMPARLAAIPGEPGAVAAEGCTFALRCPHCQEECRHQPPLRQVYEEHWNACHRLTSYEGGRHEPDTSDSAYREIVSREYESVV